jgi:DNA polymerase III epsilon subunit-like protein
MPMTMKVVTDLETMGDKPGCAIVAIGAAIAGPEQYSTFYVTVDLQSCIDAGLVVSGSTVEWWLKQEDAAREEIYRGASLTIKSALDRFSRWYPSGAVLVGNGSDFDNTILAAAYAACGMQPPWEFWDNRCYRTLKNMHKNIKLDRVGVHHNALDDAVTQAEHLERILNDSISREEVINQIYKKLSVTKGRRARAAVMGIIEMLESDTFPTLDL